MKLYFDANQEYQLQAIQSVVRLFEGQILKNLREVQKNNGLPVSEKFEGMNFSVEMETGTGKTYGKYSVNTWTNVVAPLVGAKTGRDKPCNYNITLNVFTE